MGINAHITVKGHPVEAAGLRAWAADHVDQIDAPTVVDEFFTALLAAGASKVEVSLIGEGDRLRIAAAATEPVSLPPRSSQEAGWRVIAGLSRTAGITADEHGLWAELDLGAKGIAGAFRYCNWCEGYASDVRLVAAVDVGSGAQQMTRSACTRHREKHGLTPLADRPL
ncbi:hypothetical protein ACUXZZ_20705 [Streptomyces graminifolii]|uniref:hypothetical protein n=1 Tax=Streptomyces graminifolii TaxID=1266771 RepID=UPI00405806C8